METKTCKKCNKDFTPTKKTQVYCSRVCLDSRGRLSIDRVCVRDGCSVGFVVSTRTDPKKYCSKSCSATVSNSSNPRRKRTRPDAQCKDCGVAVLYYRSYCDEHKYGGAFRRAVRIASWLSGEWDGSDQDGALNKVIRDYVLELSGHKCSICGFDTPHPSDGTSILEVDHTNGDGVDHSPGNLRVLCPNCHALTPTYRARNMGKGREYRRSHYVKKADRS